MSHSQIMALLQDIRISWIEKIDSLITSNYQVPLMIFAYLYFVLDYAPRFMKNRQPYSLKTFMKIYNIVQILGNAWMLYDMYDAGFFTKEALFCSAQLDFSNDIIKKRIYASSCYYLSLKILDYVETGVFVLRKKDSQVSVLHVYHHVSTMFVAWITAKYRPCIMLMIAAACNNFIHAVMYIYYYLATLGPNVQKQIAPVKRWITIMQMVQFCFIILYMAQNFLPGCKVMPYWYIIFFNGNILMNFYLFFNFYKETYMKPKSS